MTNRDYLRNLSNEKLAKLLNGLNGLKIFNLDCMVCDDGNCTRCITKWLDTKRETSVEKGQIRETDSHKWLVRSVSTNHNICGIVSETGVIWYIPTDIVDTWEIVADETEEMFYNRITHDFSNILKEINKEYECLYFTANGWVDQ